MKEIINVMEEIEELRSYLVVYTIESGDFIQDGVLQLSCRLDELINSYYKLLANNKRIDSKIA
jgi:hypothetical protein